MARSGSYDFSVAGDNIIKGAIRLVKGIGGATPQGGISGQQEIEFGRQALNMMLKDWQSSYNIGLWLNKEIHVFLAYRTGSYSLGSSGDHASLTVVETELASDHAAAAGTLTVDSITGISSGDAIGIELDDNTLQWTTVNGAPSGSTITLTVALTGAAAENNNVYTYTTKSQRPLDVKEARLYHDDGTETPLDVCTRQEWYDIPNKTANGTPYQVYYDRQLDSGVLHVVDRPNTVDNYIKLTCRYPIQDIDAAANDPDFPVEVHRAVKFGLAADIALEYPGVDPTKFQILSNKASRLFNEMRMADAEYGSYYFEAEDV